MSDKINNFGVIGAGIMGRGIAEVAVSKGDFEKVIMYDIEQKQLDSALKTIEGDLNYLIKKGKIDDEFKNKVIGKIITTLDLNEFSDCDFIIEAATEKFEIKEKIFKELTHIIGKNTYVASNTSSIPITLLGSFTSNPEKFIGMHFMNPVPRMKGVEIIKGVYTSEETYDKTLELTNMFGKQVTFSKDKAGFVINRILMPMLNDAISGINEGIAALEQVEKYFTDRENGLAHRMGPFLLSDLIGLDTVYNILKVIETELGNRFSPSELLEKMVTEDELGLKKGKGFYIWEGGKPQKINPFVIEHQDKKPSDDSYEKGKALATRAWLIMVNEAVKVVGEGTSSISDVDRGCVFCLNHPEGILTALDKFGIKTAVEKLEGFEKEFGEYYKPDSLLKRVNEAGITGKDEGEGFYLWDVENEKIEKVNPALQNYLS